jgi:uncharacterized C2H2 Zn-finger protein
MSKDDINIALDDEIMNSRFYLVKSESDKTSCKGSKISKGEVVLKVFCEVKPESDTSMRKYMVYFTIEEATGLIRELKSIQEQSIDRDDVIKCPACKRIIRKSEERIIVKEDNFHIHTNCSDKMKSILNKIDGHKSVIVSENMFIE